jgi:hypothetical protein
VATRLEFRLYPLDAVVGGLLAFGGNGVREALRRFRDVVASSPRELSCQAGISVDESLAPALVVAPCYTGSAADPEELRSLRSGSGPVDDGARAHSFLEQQGVFDSAYGENRDYWKGPLRARASRRADRRAAPLHRVNYMQADEPIERVRAAFGDEAFARLQALKRRYDPTNVLRRNQNIPPGALVGGRREGVG